MLKTIRSSVALSLCFSLFACLAVGAPVGVDADFAASLKQQSKAFGNGEIQPPADFSYNIDKSKPYLSEGQKVMDAAQAHTKKTLAANTPASSAPPGDEVTTYVFISTGMPEGVLRQLFRQGEDNRKIMFVVRGWTPPRLVDTAKLLAKAMPDPQKHSYNVIFDPRLYATYKIDRVPVVLHKTKKNEWRRLTGEISIQGAQKMMESGTFGRTVGPTHAIAEPDILKIIQDRAASHDWESEQAKLKEKTQKQAWAFHVLPRAPKDREIFTDPSVTVTDDVVGPNNQIIAKKGTVINPLLYVQMRPTIVFDPNDKTQRDIVSKWRKSYPNAMLIAAGMPDKNAGADGLHDQVFPLNKQLSDRFGFVNQPALAVQEGLYMKITEKK